MADKVLTIPAPDATTAGIQITIRRTATGPGNLEVAVIYVANGMDGGSAVYSAEDVAALPSRAKDALEAVFTAVVSASLRRMGF